MLSDYIVFNNCFDATAKKCTPITTSPVTGSRVRLSLTLCSSLTVTVTGLSCCAIAGSADLGDECECLLKMLFRLLKCILTWCHAHCGLLEGVAETAHRGAECESEKPFCHQETLQVSPHQRLHHPCCRLPFLSQ